MLSSAAAKDNNGSALVSGGGQSVANAYTIWYSRARVKPKGGATAERYSKGGATAERYSPNALFGTPHLRHMNTPSANSTQTVDQTDTTTNMMPGRSANSPHSAESPSSRTFPIPGGIDHGPRDPELRKVLLRTSACLSASSASSDRPAARSKHLSSTLFTSSWRLRQSRSTLGYREDRCSAISLPCPTRGGRVGTKRKGQALAQPHRGLQSNWA